MNRVEELTLKLADIGILGSEADELARLLAENPSAQHQYLRLLELEAALRSRHVPAGLEASVVSVLRSECEGRVSRTVMDEIRSDTDSRVVPFASPKATRSRWLVEWRESVRPLALAASIALTLGLGWWYFGATMGAPMLAEVSGTGAIIERKTTSIPAIPDIPLQPGDTLRAGTNATLSIVFSPETTRFELKPGGELTLNSLQSGKRFHLASGTLEAVVARQRPFAPLVISTPNATATVLGTRFILRATANQTRLQVDEGEVRFVGTTGFSARPIDVQAGCYSIVAPETELSALPKTGTITREWWTNVTGSNLSDLPGYPHFASPPDGRDTIDAFELTPVQTNRLLMRFRGYLHPPVSGDYEFWIAGAHSIRLFMCEGTEPPDKTLIAGNTERPLAFRDWDAPRYQGGSQWCPPMRLVAGRLYYIEALVLVPRREGHLSVAWKRPGTAREVLTREFLSPINLQE